MPNDAAQAKQAQVTADHHAQTAGGANVDANPTMHVRVASPFAVYFNEEAYSMSGINATGPFDILPRHHNFMSLLDACELLIRTRTGDSRVKISGGIMHVKADKVDVFLNV